MQQQQLSSHLLAFAITMQQQRCQSHHHIPTTRNITHNAIDRRSEQWRCVQWMLSETNDVNTNSLLDHLCTHHHHHRNTCTTNYNYFQLRNSGELTIDMQHAVAWRDNKYQLTSTIQITIDVMSLKLHLLV